MTQIMHSSVYTRVVSAFPGTGKTYYFNNSESGKVLDSDSSKFDKQYFPANYIDRDALVDNDIRFLLVYPGRELKEEYIERYKNMGNPPEFISLVEKNWDAWIDELDNQMGCAKIKLKSKEYLWDALK